MLKYNKVTLAPSSIPKKRIPPAKQK